MCTYILCYFFLCTLGTLRANYSVAFPKKCGNAAMLQSGKNTVLIG